MFKRISLAIVIVLVLSLVLAINIPMAAARDAGVPFKATYQGIPVGVFDPMCACLQQTFEFNGWATHLGEGHLSSTGVTSVIPPMPQEGEGTLLADNGDLLYWEFEGSAKVLRPGEVEFSGNYTITGGTGRFAGVTGTGTYWGTAIANTSGILYLDGKLFK